MNFFSGLRKHTARPIRRIVGIFVRLDPKTGEPIAFPVDGQETTLSKEGSPDTINIRYAQFHHCKHSLEAPLGGECFECSAQSCVQCHGNCDDCKKPICLSCSRFEKGQRNGPRRCQRCYEAQVRKAIALSLTGWFVHDDSDDNEA